MSESKRWLTRVTSNYTGLFVMLLTGLVTSRLLITTLGESAYGIFVLFGFAAGIGLMVEDIVRQSMIRELGHVYHEDPDRFPDALSGGFWLAGGATIVMILGYAVLWLCVPIMRVAPELHEPARWFILAKTIQSATIILSAPLFNMYMVLEYNAYFNLFKTLERVGMLLAACALLFLGVAGGPALIWFGFLTAALSGLATVGSTVGLAIRKPQLRPRAGRGLAFARSIFRSCMLNTVAITGVNSHVRVDALLLNLSHGLSANTAFGIAVQLTGYCRQIGAGLTRGLAAVSTRMTSRDGGEGIAWLIRQSTRTHMIVILPAVILVGLFTPELLVGWLGPTLREDPELLAMTVLICRVMLVGITVRTVTDPWIEILYGAGKLRSYFVLLVLAGVLNPVLALLLYRVLPEPISYIAPVTAFGIVFIVFHGIGLGRVLVREMDCPASTLLAALGRPTLMAGCGLLVYAAAILIGPAESLVYRLFAGLLFVLVYGLLVVRWCLSPREREVLGAIVRRITRRGPRRGKSSDA